MTWDDKGSELKMSILHGDGPESVVVRGSYCNEASFPFRPSNNSFETITN